MIVNTEGRSFEFLRNLEWLESNGVGGFASGTASGAHSRRYHGLLIAALRPPVQRMALLSKLDATILTDHGRFELGANQYPGAVHPRGFSRLTAFERGLCVSFRYTAPGAELNLQILCPSGENTTLLRYEYAGDYPSIRLQLEPFYAIRDFHALTRANADLRTDYQFKEGVLSTRCYATAPELHLCVPDSSFVFDPRWHYNFEYAIEQERGMDYQEDLFRHGYFALTLERGKAMVIAASLAAPRGRDLDQLWAAEMSRRRRLAARGPGGAIGGVLRLAGDQFIVARSRGRSVIAGYHWFADWGRDTMISLPGLTFFNGRHAEARSILREFAGHIDQGMLPNRFPDHGEAAEYNTVDAALWYILAIHGLVSATQDYDFAREMLPSMEGIVRDYIAGTRYGIRVDPADGLLRSGEPGLQLTWMDAKIGDYVVTPRTGKAVEINALWFNALHMVAALLQGVQQAAAAQPYLELATQISGSFTDRFWNEGERCLYDCIADDGTGDGAVRPNQIYAISLPYALLSGEKAEAVLRTVERDLLTPRGLRSLSPRDSRYRGVYQGSMYDRDSVYHQGTVWAFLLGAFVDALVAVRGEAGRLQAQTIIQQFLAHLDEAGVGALSEIFDGDAPHRPRGCIAQAWSVAEVYRVIVQHKLTL